MSIQDELRWGVVATGRIAATVTGDIQRTAGSRVAAVASRDLARARAFAQEHGVERAHGSYADLLADDGIDAVYVATPHAQHHGVARAALEAGVPVLCEKPLTVTLAAAQDLVRVAREHRTFLMEAMWTRFTPLVRRIRALVADGAVGEVRTVHAHLGFVSEPDPSARLWDPAQGGGALLDLGVYPVAFAQMLLGAPSTTAVRGSLGPTGVDAEAGLLLGWPDGAHALLTASLRTPSVADARIVGTRGRIDVDAPLHHPTRAVLHRDGAEPEVLSALLEGRGYGYQVTEVHERLRAGDLESPEMTWQDTLDVMAVLDGAMGALGAERVTGA